MNLPVRVSKSVPADVRMDFRHADARVPGQFPGRPQVRAVTGIEVLDQM
jgi:hypothetical protein